MSEMVERVARAIFDGLITKGGPGRTMMPWEVSPARAWCVATARAAIAAMREPTEKISGICGAYNETYPGDQIWRMAIDEILAVPAEPIAREPQDRPVVAGDRWRS